MARIGHRRAVLWLVLLALACALPKTLRAQPARQQQHARLIVQFSHESYVTHCVSFGQDSITGLDLLKRAGLEVITWGTAVCRIEEAGCDFPRERCFCQCLAPPCHFWSYWQWQDGRWVYSQIGAGQHQVRDGDAEAWVWGDGQNPPVVTPTDVICPSGENTPAPQVGPAATPQQPRAPSTDTPLNSGDSEGRRPGTGMDILFQEYAAFAAISAALLISFFRLRLRHERR